MFAKSPLDTTVKKILYAIAIIVATLIISEVTVKPHESKMRHNDLTPELGL